MAMVESISSVELLDWVGVADYLCIDKSLPASRRARKIKNWLLRGFLPRWTTVKIGKEIRFIKSELEKFVIQNKQA